MRKAAVLSLAWALPALVRAHAGAYHNYTGLPLLVFALVLIAALALYEFRGKTIYGKAVLAAVVAAIFLIEILFPTTNFFSPGGGERHATQEGVASCFQEHEGEPFHETLEHCQEEICLDDMHCMEEVEELAASPQG